ncbi:DUF4255 domain-containing protein [Kitasatospora sp. NBC_00240]|uniref:DUF4255 domain-containing protein n=1 Tax=Kitasatospora sp. NBC_00240 TaxID=2903567 RepID=UPI002253346A|nr:DUF4255 domain-containing protein [Kitasatospora sp. NBC_00240]MCX5213559.1 DUF4255 domain-containing protein [Kitasatospora sp. NBC_00240]
MIHEVDEALSALLGAEILGTTGVEVLFDAPTREWAARRNGPTVNVFLYDIKEDPSRREHGRRRELGASRGELLAEHEPPRWFALSYLVTAWTKRPQDEHRLLSVLLSGLIGRPALEPERLSGALAQLGLPLPYTVAAPPAGSRGLADVWSALGGELKPSLDLVVTAPIAGARRLPAALVTDALLLGITDAGGGEGAAREVRRPRFEDEPSAPARSAEPMGARRARGAGARAAKPGGIAR